MTINLHEQWFRDLASLRYAATPKRLPVKDMVCFWRAATVYVDGEAVDTSMPGE